MAGKLRRWLREARYTWRSLHRDNGGHGRLARAAGAPALPRHHYVR